MLGALAATPAHAAGIATVTDVINDGYRQPPGDRERRVAPSDELVSDEALRTARDSRIAVTFIDGSELNVEALSELVLSDYVFDPAAASASGRITLNSGLFHFNSNSVADEKLVLQTPVATIGIRGTQFLVTVADDTTIVDILEGKVEVKPSGGGKPITCEGGQSVLVAGARSDAVCGDLGAFTTAAAPPAARPDGHDNNGRDRSQSAAGPSGGGSKPGGGNPGGGGDPGGGDPGGGDPGEGKGNRSGHGDGSNPGKGNGKGGGKNGGTNNPGGANK